MTTIAKGRERLGSRAWADEAVARIEADANRSADTHLHPFPLPEAWGIDLYLKDESVHPTGSLKHRLARSLFLYGLCNGWIEERTTIVDASSGSTAVSEAYFARFLGLPYVAVMPAAASSEKIAVIEAQGGSCHLVDDPTTMYEEARRLAAEHGGYFVDQFTYAERAMVWRGSNNIAESIFSVVPSFLPEIVDRMFQVPDAASIATMRFLRTRTGRSVGGSTGTNVWGAFQLAAEMLSRGEQGSIVTLICDGGDRYSSTYYSDAWIAEQGLELAPYTEALETFVECGAFGEPARA